MSLVPVQILCKTRYYSTI